MPRIFFVKCYLTRPEFEKAKQEMHIRGNTSLSDYVRCILTESNSLFLAQKVVENNKILKRLEEQLLNK